MGLFDDMFGAPDPTRHWKEIEGLVPDVDFTAHAFCGVKIGDPAAWLEKLGRCEDQAAAKEGEFRWYTKGFAVDVDTYAVAAFIVHFDDDRGESYRPFAGRCLLGGREVTLTRETTENDFVKLFGAPYWRDLGEVTPPRQSSASSVGGAADEVILFYEFGRTEWQVEFTKDRTLRLVLVLSPPMLEDEEQRKTYKIDRPWPPPSP